ncbi:hypothetical protein QBC35DRAFT_547752 [Podospora australis]|uniref:Uncharacterized protein n=1 Tax=Podospora australis TaxID=1536484 RepID=A0AAN6WHY7_9PEZI|nr:hypothetical protein QBC35DRAFT_547752 [Podospora australis]
MVAIKSFLLAAVALLASPTLAWDKQTVVDNLENLRQDASSILTQVRSVNFLNGNLIAVGQGPFPDIVDGVRRLGVIALSYSQVYEGAEGNITSDADAEDIATQFSATRLEINIVLGQLIGKANLFNVPLVGIPIIFSSISEALVFAKPRVARALPNSLILLLDAPSEDAEATIMEDGDSLARLFDDAIAAWQVGIPLNPPGSK